MKHLGGGIRGEILKMRHTFLFPFHGAVPVLGAVMFLLYYSVSGWSEPAQISGYIEICGIALPFAVSIVCAGNIRLEEQNHFQVFLGSYVQRWKALAVKCLVLSGTGFLTILAAVVLFGAGYSFLLGKEGISMGVYVCLAAVLFLGSIPLYLEHLFLNLVFSGAVSQCIGAAQFLLSALFLTGLGDGKWQFFPCAWSARGAMLLLGGIGQGQSGGAYLWELKKASVICLLLLAGICVIIGIWFHYYEGRHCND